MGERSSVVSGAAITERQWPFAAGAVAEWIRSNDWSGTPLGAVDGWPVDLRIALDMTLACRLPATLQWGPELRFFCNDSYIPVLGRDRVEALGRSVVEVFPETAAECLLLAEKVRSGEQVTVADHCLRRGGGDPCEELWFDLHYSPVHDQDGEVVGIFGVGVETTPRRLAERAKASADMRLRRVLETEAVGVIFFDYTGTVVDANDVFLKMTGYSREEIEARKITWRTMTPPEWIAASEQQMENLARTGRLGPYEKEYILKDGTRRWMLFAGRDLGDGMIAEYAIDISGAKRAEQASHAMEQRFRALVESSSDVLYSMSPDWTELRQLHGGNFVTQEQTAESWLEHYVPPEDRQAVWASVQEALQTERAFELEHRVMLADGSIGWTVSRAVPLRNEKNEIIEWFGMAQDVTARKRTEAALLKNDKLATLGRLAASIAHEINNPLESTTNLLYLAQSVDALPAESKHYLTLAETELRRVAHITRRSLGFYRESNMALEASVTELLEESIDLLRGKIVTKGVQIHRHWNDEDFRIRAAPGELRQVFSNLLANSVDAVDPEGAIAIRISKRFAGGKPHLRVTFADSGCGIDPSKRESIFDPFYSTKGNLGTGLGLWITQRIVEKHRGSIRMRSRSMPPKTGTVFSLTFPL